MEELINKTFTFSLYDIIGLLIIYQSLIFFIFLLNRKQSGFIVLLRIIYLVIILHFAYIMIENNILHTNYMFGLFFGLVYGPLFYFYTKSLIFRQFKINKQIVQFIPAGLTLFLLILVNSIKDDLMKGIEIYSVLIISVYILFYLVLSLSLIYSYNRILPSIRSNLDKISLRWLKITIYILVAAILLALIEASISFPLSVLTNYLISLIFILIMFLVISLYYLGFRHINHFSGLDETEIKDLKHIRKHDISEEEKTAISEKLNRHIEKEMLFKEFELSINDLADRLSISARKISIVINDNFKMNFFDYVNSHRIDYAKELLQQSKLSIKEIMYDSGFGNKSTFNASFKKLTGLSPSEYRKKKS